MAKRVKTNYDRGYVNAMDKIRVFIESSSKVMYVDTREYKNAFIKGIPGGFRLVLPHTVPLR